MSFNPPNNPIDLSAGYADMSALLQLLADPVKTKARLDELIAAEAAAKERLAEANAMAAETRRLHSTAAATNIVAERREAAAAKREEELDQRAQKLETVEARASAASMRAQQSAVEAAALANKREAERLAAMRTELDAGLAKIKNFRL
jgi:hypothetical protein